MFSPNTAEAWVPVARAASQAVLDVPVDELLLVRDLAGQRFRSVGPPNGITARPGAVLLLLYPENGDLCLPLTVRSKLLPNHRGEISLPGGATDPLDAGPVATALRECQEEIGVAPDELDVWGTLSTVYIMPSNFEITPVVAFSPHTPELRINPAEVDRVLHVTLRELLDPATVEIERWTLRGVEVDVPFFAIDGHKVWGATALVLSEFVARVRWALVQESNNYED